ncbi:MAG: serine/threonine-protein phosphatase [Ottowia sp.]|uniref:PP2C family protein-serine/threonine phosphatase n=1 Tax=Ottowia sp. TaxID=1898956 RepID=UPI001DF3838D|nr:protein phosphatase 2C domain-containing protein [Ottowia sp.]MCP5257260.1 serine/threonine-protein phosphatase [Burkholderiaceae bacterium]MCB2025475.1 serine/threonine-protein phosphatase [Ottowia sp.]MCB2034893.1 serine/threonine-protein phosphatase [Ottowia sp.]MCB2070858.1 serine/threonine-protein phosphatase [Ottowia sp.]HPK31091.1 protein phosphatase 2C domain-containing protein [Ottowia sp.]
MDKGYRLSGATGLHKGDREYQQDQVGLFAHPSVQGCVLGVVADGMGGRTGGRKASDQVLLTARQLFERYVPEDEDAAVLLQQIGQEAHLVIKLTAIAAEQEPHSTVAAFLINPGGECHWVHAGDSRIYHFRGTTLVRRTTDQSYVQALVQKGELSPEEAEYHPKSNVLVSCLGTEEEPKLDVHYIPQLQIGDTLLACSDGVWHYFTTEELASVLASLPPREASEFLIEKARARAQGGGDNLSLAIVKVEKLADDKPPVGSGFMPLRRN